MCEVEAIMNERPITKVSDDPNDMSALTPNHLLFLREYQNVRPGIITKDDTYRRKWKQIQYMANQFWSRWEKEYLPTLQERQKWFNQQANTDWRPSVNCKSKHAQRTLAKRSSYRNLPRQERNSQTS